MVCVELCPCAKNIVHAVDQSSFLMRETLTRVTVYAPWRLVLVHAYLQVCAHVVRSWGTSVSYRNQLRHIPWPDYLGTRCFVTSSFLVLVTLLARSRGSRPRGHRRSNLIFDSVEFLGQRGRRFISESVLPSGSFDSSFVLFLDSVACSFLVLTDAAGSTIQSLLTFGNCWLIGSRAVIV